ncbi:MAG TPA: trypsin-like peptidase domain-containing protein [Anaerolineae bacterium]
MATSHRGWFLVAIAFAVIVGAIGGGLVGGVVGYTAAGRAQPTVEAAPPAAASGSTTQIISEESGLIQAVQTVEPAVVLIQNQGRGSAASGSGVITSRDGYIVTNNHVVEGAVELLVVYYDGREVSARLIGTYPTSDLAVIKVEGDVPGVAELGDSDALQLGTRVIAIGSALGRFQNTVTTGIVSGLGRQVGGINGLIQTDASINHGNSGGPLVNLAGQVVGINSMVVRAGGGDVAEGLGFAIPSNVVRAVSEQLIARGAVRRAYLGIRYRGLQGDEAQRANLPVGAGAAIESVEPDGPASQAGLQQGDLIVAIDGQSLNSASSLPALMLTLQPGDTITLHVVRGDATSDVTVTLGEFPG